MINVLIGDIFTLNFVGIHCRIHTRVLAYTSNISYHKHHRNVDNPQFNYISITTVDNNQRRHAQRERCRLSQWIVVNVVLYSCKYILIYHQLFV